MKFELAYNRNYKKLLIIPAIVLSLSLIYLTIFSIQNGDIINKDVSLTGGSTITIPTDIPSQDFEIALSKNLTDFTIKTISDNSGNQLELAITVGEQDSQTLENALEDFLDYELTSENSSIEKTSASLSDDFYKQLIVAVILAFFWMAAVVFLIFARGKAIKVWVIVLNVLLGFFMGNFFLSINPILSTIIFLVFSIAIINIYIKNSVPAFAVMLSAFANIAMTLAVVDLIGMRLSTAGIIAFLMLIGYSVDTDILLTTRLLKRNTGVNSALFGAFKTGTTMTLTSIIAITASFTFRKGTPVADDKPVIVIIRTIGGLYTR